MQFSRLKSAITALLLTLLMSPEASFAVGSLVVNDGLGDGEADGLDDVLGLEEACGVGEGEDVAPAAPSALALAAWPDPPDGDGEAAALLAPLAFGLADADGLGEEDGLGDGDAPAGGVADTGVGLPGAASSTWRNLSTADRSSGAMSSALLCGTDTTM